MEFLGLDISEWNEGIVITSYSIHYTKLYEKQIDPAEYTKDISKLPKEEQDLFNDGYKFNGNEWIKTVDASKMSKEDRITSYNVCYTKLLRSAESTARLWHTICF